MNMNIITIIIIAVTVIFSFKGFNDPIFFDRYKFNVGAIIKSRQWDRMITSAFLHGDVMHLIFNMFTFYFFSNLIIQNCGIIFFLILYVGSILTGNLLSLDRHKKENYYSAIGASGGVSGILFASIAFSPTIEIFIFTIPKPIPGWIFGIIYLAYSVYGMRAQLGNIGHEAHLGGAVFGIIVAILFSILFSVPIHINYLLIMLIPLAFLAYLVYKEK